MTVFKYVIISLWLVLGFIIFLSSKEEQVVLDETVKKYFSQMFPEGWGFFTKNPREDGLRIYALHDNTLKEIHLLNQSLSTYFGLSRKRRNIAYEASVLASAVRSQDWIENKFEPLENFISIDPTILESKKGFVHLTSGVYLIQLFKPVPFAWSDEDQQEHNPFRIAKIIIKENAKLDK